ncbi:hypothetical protein GCM10028805_49260 [Spirosoma harenae]
MNRIFHSFEGELRRMLHTIFTHVLLALPGPWTLVFAIAFYLFCQALQLVIKWFNQGVFSL